MVLAGQIIRAADFAGYATDSDSTDETNVNVIAYTLGGTTVGTSFVAPTSGNVNVTVGGRLNLNSTTASYVYLAAEIRTGSVVGSGTVIAAAEDDWALQIGLSTNNRIGGSRTRPISGLTAGTTYNVSLWHRNHASVAGAITVIMRDVTVVGVP